MLASSVDVEGCLVTRKSRCHDQESLKCVADGVLAFACVYSMAQKTTPYCQSKSRHALGSAATLILERDDISNIVFAAHLLLALTVKEF